MKQFGEWIRLLPGSDRRPRYMYAGHHKCATQFTERVLRAVCKKKGLRADVFDARHASVGERAKRSLDFLLVTDYSTGIVDEDVVERVRGVHAIRDPRDLLVSMYFSHRYSHAMNHPEIVRNRTALERLSEPEGLSYMMNQSHFFTRVVQEMDGWNYDRSNFFETNFERLTKDPANEFERILSFLEIGLKPGELEAIIGTYSFDSLKEEWAARNPDAPVNHYRRGIHGDWSEHLFGVTLETFRERYGALLVKLGYEDGYDW